MNKITVIFFSLVLLSLQSTAGAATTTITVKNRTNTDRIQWVHTTVPFARGEVQTEADLYQYSVGHGTLGWRAMKWHFTDGAKDSVALAALRMPVYLTAGQEIKMDVVKVAFPNPLPFRYGPNFTAVIDRGTLGTDIFAVAKFKGDPRLYYATFLNNIRTVFSGVQTNTYAVHSNFEEKALSMSIWMDINNRQDFGNFVISIGNQTFERPHSGGIEIDYVDLYVQLPLMVEIRHGADYGAGPSGSAFDFYRVTRLISGDHIADGAARTFRGLWGAVFDVESLNGRSFQAELDDPLFGISDEASWRASDSAGITGAISPPRGTLAELRENVEWKCTDSFEVHKDTGLYIKYVNKKPSITGDQIDFSSNMPVVYQQAILAQSACPIQHLLHATQQETHRPAYYFFENRPMRWSDTSSGIFWWSGRIHYHPAQNPKNSAWASRIDDSFELGPTYDWSGPDNQHYGHHHIRAAYELTGDGFLYDLIVYHQSMALWNHLGDGKQRPRDGSERGQRLMEDAIQDYVIAPDAPEAKNLGERIARKIHEVIRPTVQDRLTRYGVAAWETVYDDGRYSNCLGTTPGLNPEENICHVVWQSGFNLSALAAAYRHGITRLSTGAHADVEWIIDGYLDHWDFRFHNDGNHKGSVRFNDWNSYSSGYSHSWLSGWIPAVKLRQNHKNWVWFRDTFIPYMRENSFKADPGHFWGDNDQWRNFE